MRRFVGQVVTIAGKDLRLELRSRERIMSMLTFAVLVAVVFSFAMDPGVNARTARKRADDSGTGITKLRQTSGPFARST